MKRYRTTLVLSLILVLLATVFCYRPGLNGPFVFDDRGNIVEASGMSMKTLTWQSVSDAARSRAHAGYLHRPIPRVTFALTYYFSGERLDRWVFKVTNVSIHLLNGVLLFGLTSVLMGCWWKRAGGVGWVERESLGWWLALLVMGLWVLHPLQLTSVLYVVQRMTSMAGTAVFLGLLLFVVGRRRYGVSPRHGLIVMGVGLVGGTSLGVMCKENAALLPLFGVLVELFFFTRDELSEGQKRGLKLFYGLIFGLMAMVGVAVFVSATDRLTQTYRARDFTIVERLATQPRVLFYYLWMMVYPSTRELSLYHDDIEVSEGLLMPWTTLPSAGGVLGLLLIGWWGLRRGWMLGFGVLWYLVGHGMESSVFGLELAHEHRNYVPMYGVVLVLGYYGMWVAVRVPSLSRALVMAGVVFMGILGLVTYTRSSIWSSLDEMSYFDARNHPNSYRALVEYGSALERQGADVREIYATYRAAVSVTNGGFVPLIRMQRIVSGLQKYPEALESLQESVTTGPTDILSDDLILDTDYLDQLDVLIDAETTRRLGEVAVRAETTLALRELHQCVITFADSCPPASRVERWLEITLGSEKMPGLRRSNLLLTYAQLKAFRGDIDGAVTMVEEAFAMSPNEMAFLMQLVVLYNLLNDYDSAERTLERIVPLVREHNRRVGDYEKLLRATKKQRAEYEEYVESVKLGEATELNRAVITE